MEAIEKLLLKNFTAFREAEFEFSPGINVLIGENGTGKTHVLKLIYVLLKLAKEAVSKEQAAKDKKLKPEDVEQLNYYMLDALNETFKPDLMIRLIRQVSNGEGDLVQSEIELSYGQEGSIGFQFASRPDIVSSQTKRALYAGQSFLSGKVEPKIPNAIYLPSREIISIYPGFIAAYLNRETAFDQTYFDLAVALDASPLRGDRYNQVKDLAKPLGEVFGGEDKVTKEGNYFFVELPNVGKTSVQLVAEGHRKLATLAYLVRNGSLAPNMVLLWDEPEANLNPKLVTAVVEFLVNLTNAGVQIFIATHDYLLSQELSLQVEYQQNSRIRFFSLYHEKGHDGVLVESGNSLIEIENNPILDGFIAHHDRENELSYAVSD